MRMRLASRCFFLDEDLLTRLLDALPYRSAMLKRHQTDEEWKGVHMSFCLKHGLGWPRDLLLVECSLAVPNCISWLIRNHI